MLNSIEQQTFIILFTFVVNLLHNASLQSISPQSRVTAKMSTSYYTTISLGEPNNFKQGFNDVGLENSTAWIASCESVGQGKKCMLIVHLDLERKNEEVSCEFYLIRNSSTFKIAQYLRVFRINDEVFLVSWVQYDRSISRYVEHVGGNILPVGIFVSFVIIHLEKSEEKSKKCSIYEAMTTGSSLKIGTLDHKDLIDNITIHLYGDVFSVFYIYDEDHNFAQEIFNLKGERQGKPTGKDDFLSNDEARILASYPKKIDTEKCFGTLRPQERFRVIPDSSDKDFSPYPIKPLKKSRRVTAYTTSNGNISSCRGVDKDPYSWICSQGEWGARKNELKLTFEYIADDIVIYNLPGGGLLTLTRKKSNDDSSPNYFYLTKFDGIDGQAQKDAEFAMLPCVHSVLWSHFYPDVSEGICLSLLYKSSEFEIIIGCYR